MNLHTNDLMLQELRNTKHMHTIDLAVGEYPYYDTDNNTKNVFFLYDDRGVDIYSDDEGFIYEMKTYSF